jgi:hypothetical protein
LDVGAFFDDVFELTEGGDEEGLAAVGRELLVWGMSSP